MKYLLDTHVVIWALSAPTKLSKKAREILEDGKELSYYSAVSVWEISLKVSIGRLKFPLNDLEDAAKDAHIFPLSLTSSHPKRLPTLPEIHHDPFDRILICQALEENLSILTADKIFSSYPVKTTW